MVHVLGETYLDGKESLGESKGYRQISGNRCGLAEEYKDWVVQNRQAKMLPVRLLKNQSYQCHQVKSQQQNGQASFLYGGVRILSRPLSRRGRSAGRGIYVIRVEFQLFQVGEISDFYWNRTAELVIREV